MDKIEKISGLYSVETCNCYGNPPFALTVCGDCIDGMRSLPDKSVDCIISDLPYGCTKNKWDVQLPLDKLWNQYKRVIKDRGVIILFSQGMFTAALMMSNPGWWHYNMVWIKNKKTGFLNARKQPLRVHEDICVFYKKAPVYHPVMSSGPRKVVSAYKSKLSSNYDKNYKPTGYDSDRRFPTSVLEYSSDSQFSHIHPTQKPVALLEYLIRLYTEKSDIILDSCMGSGTTCIASARTGRNFIGFEIDKRYYKAAKQRIIEELI